jgi:acyl-coenzyme A thioesterase PaaI-like protein
MSDLTSHFVVAPEAAFDAHLGHEFLSPTTSRITLRAAHLGPDGTVRSGVYAAVAESLASTGTAVEVVPHGFFPSGLSNSTHVVGDAREGVLEAVAHCRARGELEWLWLVEIGPPGGTPTAIATVAIAVRPVRETKRV